MTSGIQFEQGEIVIVPFPFSDLNMTKQRPVLILSNNRHNSSSDDIITCGITSNLKDTEYSILIDNDDLEYGNLPIKSRIKIDKIFTLEKTLFKKSIGKINKSVLNKVKIEFIKLV